MHNKFEKDTWKTFQVIAPTRSNYWRKRWKIAISRPFWIFFQPLLNLSEKWSLVTCKTNLGRKHEKLFKLSRPQVNVNADATPNFNCNSPPFLIKIKRRAKNHDGRHSLVFSGTLLCLSYDTCLEDVRLRRLWYKDECNETKSVILKLQFIHYITIGFFGSSPAS